jgi:hypothetical protein
VASSFVCFGLPAIFICTVIGVLGGLVRSLW